MLPPPPAARRSTTPQSFFTDTSVFIDTFPRYKFPAPEETVAALRNGQRARQQSPKDPARSRRGAVLLPLAAAIPARSGACGAALSYTCPGGDYKNTPGRAPPAQEHPTVHSLRRAGGTISQRLFLHNGVCLSVSFPLHATQKRERVDCRRLRTRIRQHLCVRTRKYLLQGTEYRTTPPPPPHSQGRGGVVCSVSWGGMARDQRQQKVEGGIVLSRSRRCRVLSSPKVALSCYRMLSKMSTLSCCQASVVSKLSRLRGWGAAGPPEVVSFPGGTGRWCGRGPGMARAWRGL
eukprot:gene17989-biopygen15947